MGTLIPWAACTLNHRTDMTPMTRLWCIASKSKSINLSLFLLKKKSGKYLEMKQDWSRFIPKKIKTLLYQSCWRLKQQSPKTQKYLTGSAVWGMMTTMVYGSGSTLSTPDWLIEVHILQIQAEKQSMKTGIPVQYQTIKTTTACSSSLPLEVMERGWHSSAMMTTSTLILSVSFLTEILCSSVIILYHLCHLNSIKNIET